MIRKAIAIRVVFGLVAFFVYVSRVLSYFDLSFPTAASLSSLYSLENVELAGAVMIQEVSHRQKQLRPDYPQVVLVVYF
jgi:hypothetical protein